MKKYEKYIDEQLFIQLKAEAEKAVAHVLAGIEALRAEGIPTDEATITMLTATPEALESYIRDAAKKRIGDGFVPPEEKSRIFEVYSHLLARIKEKVELMRLSLPIVPIVFEGDQITIDQKKLEKIAKDNATYEIDMEGLSAYWEKVEAIQSAMDEMRKFEEENGLPDFRNTGLHFSEKYSFHTVRLNDFFTYSPSKDGFQKIARAYFTKK